MGGVLLLIGFFLLAALFGALLFSLFGRLRRPRRAEAEVLDKRRCEYTQVSFGRHGFFGRTGQVALFRVEGKTLGLFCSEELFDSLCKGERGVLSYQGSRALDFIAAK